MADKAEQKQSFLKKTGKNIFARFFGFEQGVDITDDLAVLYRRNVVIKNIIFVTNLIYSLLLFILSLSTSQRSDWAITIIVFPLTFIINRGLTALINIDNRDITKQTVAMYIASLYIYVSSILVYARLYQSDMFETVAYVLLYYAIVLISLYQDKKLLAHSFVYLFGLMTFIHLLWTYQVLTVSNNLTIPEFLIVFKDSGNLGDLILRSLVFILFYFTVYIIVSIGQYMQEERKAELIKRRQVQNDFGAIVGNLFNAVFINAYVNLNEDFAIMTSKLSNRLASFINLSEPETKNLNDFALIHLKYDDVKDFKLDTKVIDDKVYEELKAKTALGIDIVKRMEISQNVDVISRSYAESTLDDMKLKSIMSTVKDDNSQIIMLSEIYLTFRESQSYKRPYTHSETMSIIENIFEHFYKPVILDRFKKFSDEIENEYNNFL